MDAVPRHRWIALAAALCLLAVSAAAQVPAPASAAAPVLAQRAGNPDPGPGIAGPSGNTLTERLQARRQDIATDLGLDVDQRRAFDEAIGRLITSSVALDEVMARVDAARLARKQAGPAPPPLDVDRTLAEWKARLPTAIAAAEIWPRIARLADELRSLRQGEQDLVSAAQAGGKEGIEGDPALVNPVPVDTLLATLPDVPAQTRALVALARELEQRRIDVTSATLSERRHGLVDRVGRMGSERAALADRVALAQRKLAYLDRLLEQTVQEQLRIVRAVAQRASAQAAAGSPAALAAAELPALADEAAHLLDRGDFALREADAQDARLLEISQIWNDTRDRLAVEHGSEALGLVLVSDLARTLPPGQLAGQLRGVRRELAGLRLRLIDLRSQLAAARDPLPGMQQAELLQHASLQATFDAPALLAIHFRMLLTVEAANLAIAEALATYEATLGELDRRNTELRNLIGKRLLWTPSHAAIGPRWFAGFRQRIVSGQIGADVRGQVAGALAQASATLPRTAWMLAGLAAFLALWAWLGLRRRRLLAQIPPEGVIELRQSIVAVLHCVVLAAPWALLSGLAFRVLRGGDVPSGFYESVVRDALPGFWTVLVLVGLILLAGARGAHGHVLDWSEAQCRGLRRHAIALLALIVPGHVGVSAAWFRGDLGALEYESRALFMLAWLGVAIVFWHALRPGGVWFGADSGRGSLGRRLLRMGVTGAALGAATLAALGLQITAAAVAAEIEGTIGVLATLLVVYELALVGIALGERRAAEWQAVAADLARKEGIDDAVAPSGPGRAGELVAAGTDSRRMVGFLVGVGGAVWLAAQWADLVPALWQLDDLVMWNVTVTQGGASLKDPVSLLDLLLSIVVVMLLVVGLRRLPSMADLLLRQRSAIDAGTRYAITALLRYAIAVAGIVVAFGLIGVRWSNLQWMAAALTVGLGFGLQEIFANFVSGLILLFERPVRVGDVVTVDDVTGTVAKISTRATTVVDFDRREILIPNKALITDRLINWTLSSEVTRVTVKVGVGYGTDPELVHRLLHRAAKEVPIVLEQPVPVSAFVGFGASNLDFELRACVAKFEHRLPASNALHQRILALFTEAGIGIDYDQLDVRLIGDQPPPRTATGP